MHVALLCSDSNHPIYPYLARWMDDNSQKYDIQILNSQVELIGGDILFLISCNEIVSAETRAKFKSVIVLHASDLPSGRGWSPHIWEISRGANYITLSALEAEEDVDSGNIWVKERIQIPEDALWNEINDLLFTEEINMISFIIENFGNIEPKTQQGAVTYYPRRTPRDSMIDPSKSISEQFNLIRVCDPNRYPAYFVYRGIRYTLKLEKSNDNQD